MTSTRAATGVRTCEHLAARWNRGRAVLVQCGMTLDNLIAQQAGVISRAQALAAGCSRDAVDRRLKSRRWQPLYPGVYLADRRPGAAERRGAEVRVRAALLWAGPGARLCGRAAAWWYGMAAEPPPVVGVCVDPRRRLRRRPGADVLRRELAAQDGRVHRGLAVTAPGLTVLDAAVELGGGGSAFLHDVLRRSALFAEVHAAHVRYAAAPGAATAARLLRAAVERSAAEARHELRALLRGAGVSGWTHAVRVDGHAVDAAFPLARVAVLASGWAEPPLDPRHVEATARRWTALVAQGWTVVHVTWRDLADRPHAVLAEIARHVARGAAVLGRVG